jgi:heme-degrading monooxygenase HmoA
LTASIWTHGAWTVKPGREEEFIAAWRAMARGAVEQFDPPGTPRLLRDRERPNLFRSFGPWDDPEQVERFRGFIQPHLERIRELTESIEIFTLDDVPLDE